MKIKRQKNGINLLNDFEAGQIEIIKWAKANLQRQIAEIENKNTVYLLRDSATDVFHVFKLLLQRNIWKFLLNEIEQKEKEILNEEED